MIRLAKRALGRVIVETTIKLQFSPLQPNALRVNGDNRAFLERLIIVEPVFHICDRSEVDSTSRARPSRASTATDS